VGGGWGGREESGGEGLVRLGGFVGEETGDRNSLERVARRLGLERSDLVIRRHLVEMMRLAAGWVGPDELPSEGNLEAYRVEHAAEYAPPARIRLTQVYLSGDARGAHLAADASALLADLRRSGSGPTDAAARGDAFIRGAEFDGSRADLERTFGPGFAAAVDGQPLRTWVGPLTSSYGLHLVWIDGREPPPPPSRASARAPVRPRWRGEGSEGRREETMQALRARYDVEIAAY